MYKLKIFIGIEGRWVLCEAFPDDEEHAGLSDLLADFLNEDDVFEDQLGFYLMHLVIEGTGEDAGFYVDRLERCKEGYNEGYNELMSEQKRRVEKN